MPTIKFSGTIIPTGLAVSFGRFPPVAWENIETRNNEEFIVSSTADQIDVVVHLDIFDPEDMNRHRNRALDLARAAIDVMSFQNGWGLSVSLEWYTDPLGKKERIVPGHPELAKYVTFNDADLALIYAMAVKEPPIYMALNDLIQAITWPHVAPVNCARAIEGIRTIIAPGKRGAGWPAMREALNLEESYTKFITSLSEAPRHGNRVWNTEQQLETLLKRSWIIMSRFLEWKKRGGLPLPLGSFPLLNSISQSAQSHLG